MVCVLSFCDTFGSESNLHFVHGDLTQKALKYDPTSRYTVQKGLIFMSTQPVWQFMLLVYKLKWEKKSIKVVWEE